MAKRDDEAKARGEVDELDARIDARIRAALVEFSIEHGWLHPADREAALAAPDTKEKD